jgi:phage gpG-like protein
MALNHQQNLTLLGEDLLGFVIDNVKSNIPPPNSPKWEARKIREGKGAGTLRYSGNMLQALNYWINDEGGTLELTVGIRDPLIAEYAAANEWGTDDGRIPERSFLRKAYLEHIEALVDAFFARAEDAIVQEWVEDTD